MSNLANLARLYLQHSIQTISSIKSYPKHLNFCILCRYTSIIVIEICDCGVTRQVCLLNVVIVTLCCCNKSSVFTCNFIYSFQSLHDKPNILPLPKLNPTSYGTNFSALDSCTFVKTE